MISLCEILNNGVIIDTDKWLKEVCDGMNKIMTILGVLCLGAMTFAGSVQAASIAKDGPETKADYWTAGTEDGNRVLLDAKGVQQLNEKLRAKCDALCDLKNFPQKLDGNKVTEYIAASLPEAGTYYRDGAVLSDNAYNGLMDRTVATPVDEDTVVRYAVTVQRANLRMLPTDEGWYDGPTPMDQHYDDLQNTAVDPSEPLAVLADSDDGAYVFVQMRYYRGWINKSAIAFTNRATWLTYVEPKEFLVVTKNRYTVKNEWEKEQLYQLGSRISLLGHQGRQWIVRVPQQRYNGQLAEGKAFVPMDENSLHAGYLPYTRNNVLRSAFKLLGDVYGWGGADDSVDCSALTMDAYRTVGIELPRNASQQEKAALHSVSLKGMDVNERSRALFSAKPGDILFRRGHVMLYLGRNAAGEPRILHSASSYYDYANGRLQKQYIRQVLVSDLFFLNRAGDTNLSVLTSIGSL